MVPRGGFIAAGFLCVVTSAVADDRVQLLSDPFNEVLRNAAKVSGYVVAGVLRHREQGSSDTAPAVDLAADLPPMWAGRLICTRVVSLDGLYEAENEYRLAEEWSGGVVSLPFPTVHSDLLASLAPQRLAVRVSEGGCATAPMEAAVAFWNVGEGSAPPALMVNSFGADEVFVYVGEDSAALRCEGIADAARQAFDFSCALPEDVRGEVAVTVYRLSGGNPAPPSTASVWLGLPQ